MSRRSHNVVSGVVAAAACFVVVLTIAGVWLYATLFNSARFVGTVEVVTADPAVIASVSERVATKVVDGFQIQARLEALLPDRLDPLATKVATAVQEGISTRLQQTMSNESFKAIWLSALEGMHSRFLALMRGEAPNAELASGVLTIDLLGVVGDAIAQLKADGVISQDFQLPAWAGDGDRQATIEVLNRELNITLPPDFAMVEVTNVGWLEQLSTIVRSLDALVPLLAVLSLALTAAAVWLLDRRKRGVLYMLIAIELSLLVIALVAAFVGGPFLGDIAAQQSLPIVGAMGAVLAGSLMGWIAAGMLGIAVIGLVLAFVVRNREVVGGRD
jgi:hypothetical protein